MNKVIEAYSWVLMGSQRKKILFTLENPKPISIIKEETKLNISNVSNVIKDLLKNELIICLNPKSRIGKLYQLTNKGNEVILMIKKLNP